jgi:hypothetical protein
MQSLSEYFAWNSKFQFYASNQKALILTINFLKYILELNLVTCCGKKQAS